MNWHENFSEILEKFQKFYPIIAKLGVIKLLITISLIPKILQQPIIKPLKNLKKLQMFLENCLIS